MSEVQGATEDKPDYGKPMRIAFIHPDLGIGECKERRANGKGGGREQQIGWEKATSASLSLSCCSIAYHYSLSSTLYLAYV